MDLKKVIINNVIAWVHKSISWPDELTFQGGRTTYSGDRLSSNCSASGVNDRNGSGNIDCGITAYGRINPNTKTIKISTSILEGTRAYANGGYICDSDGNRIKSLGEGNTDVSAYNDGSYYFTYTIGSARYVSPDSIGWVGCNLYVTLSSN